MAKAKIEQQGTAKAAVKLSPELREFLHMMKSLEGQLSDPADAGRR
ncbi:MAG: hypothetical protein KDK89_16965 [Alphaproteobacteria bacterium]|nr:hypothetical protein [Alphaproteobacteria bacterium]